MGCAPRRGGRYDDGRQVVVQLFTTHLEPRRQAQCRTKLFRLFVHGESGLVGRDLKKYAARFAVVDRFEVVAVDDGGDVANVLHQDRSPGGLAGVVGGPPGDVMHGTRSLFTYRRLRRLEQVDCSTWPAGPRLEPGRLTFLTDTAKAHHARQETDGCLGFGHAHRHRVEAADLVFEVDRAVRPRHPAIVRRLSDQLHLNAIKVLDQDRVGVDTALSGGA